MPTIAEIRSQIKACPHRYIFWTQKEIRALPKIMDSGEVIKGITSGMMNGATWLLVCTNRRLIFLNRGMFYGLRQVQIPLGRVQSLDHSFTIAFGTISVWDGASAFAIHMVLRNSIIPFVRATEEAIYQLQQSRTPAPQAASTPMADIATQLGKLAELKEKGYLTEEEFQAQKKKLLD